MKTIAVATFVLVALGMLNDRPICAGEIDNRAMHQQIRELSEEVAPTVVEWRRDFHAHPELSNREERTARVVAQHLGEMGIDEIETGVAHHGVVALIRGGKPGPTVALRADMDAPADRGEDRAKMRFPEQRRDARLWARYPHRRAPGHRTSPDENPRPTPRHGQTRLPTRRGRHARRRRRRRSDDGRRGRSGRSQGLGHFCPAHQPRVGYGQNLLSQRRLPGRRRPIPRHRHGQAVARGHALAGRRPHRGHRPRNHRDPDHRQPQSRRPGAGCRFGGYRAGRTGLEHHSGRSGPGRNHPHARPGGPPPSHRRVSPHRRSNGRGPTVPPPRSSSATMAPRSGTIPSWAPE